MSSKIFMEKIKKLQPYVWVTITILLVGFFLRSYNLHSWLHFGKDQARDAMIDQSVAIGTSDWPLLGATMGNTPFKIGPAYYYFQIIAAKIFGQDPAVLAFPDILFSMLSIPLLFILLKRYFSRNISLALSGLWAISYFSIEYSRFAWNTNPIPFFVILFLLSLYEFFVGGEKTNWKWIVSLGIAVGIGVQLHAILMILLPVMLLVILLFLLFKDKQNWKKASAVFLIALFLNLPQIVSEFEHNFENTKIFLGSSGDSPIFGGKKFFNDVELNLACHSQANMHIVSSLGDKYVCNYMSILTHKKSNLANMPDFMLVGLSILFSIFGYLSLILRFKKEKDRGRRFFVGMILFYCLLFFPLLMPAIDGASHRYFISVFFVPYIFLGLLLELILKNKSMVSKIVLVVVFSFFVFNNLYSVAVEASQLSQGMRGNQGFAVLGQVEKMQEYIISKSENKKTIYLFGGSSYLPFYALPFQYVFLKNDIEIVRGTDASDVGNAPIFYIWANSDGDAPKTISGRKVLEYKDFGQLGIYKLQNNN